MATWLRSLPKSPVGINAVARDFSVTPYRRKKHIPGKTHAHTYTRCSDTDDARARDSISGRLGSLTPALAPAWSRRLYYDVYGLIRDILEMSRVHARRVAHTPPGNAGKAARLKGRGSGGNGGWRGGRESAKIDVPSHADSDSSPLRVRRFPPWSSFLFPPPSPFHRSSTTCGSIVRGSINWVSTARLSTHSPCFETIREIAAVAIGNVRANKSDTMIFRSGRIDRLNRSYWIDIAILDIETPEFIRRIPIASVEAIELNFH